MFQYTNTADGIQDSKYNVWIRPHSAGQNWDLQNDFPDSQWKILENG